MAMQSTRKRTKNATQRADDGKIPPEENGKKTPAENGGNAKKTVPEKTTKKRSHRFFSS